MALSEFLSMPKGMSIEEYENLLQQEKKLSRQISSLSDKILAEDDSLDVLADEVGSERYNKHLQAKRRFEEKRTRLLNSLNEVLSSLGRSQISEV